MSRRRNQSGSSFSGTDVFLAVLAIMLISVSFYQTWQGLTQIFKGGALMVALVLSLLLLFLCWLLRSFKLKGKKTGGLVGIYIFIASFCFVANFNALYTNMMKTDIYVTELKNIEKSYGDLENTIVSNLNYKYPPDKLREIEIKKNQLKEQIKDPANVGIGKRALSLISELEKLLGQKIDLLTVRGNDYAELAERMAAQVEAMKGLDLSAEEQKLKNDIQNANLKWVKRIQEVIGMPKSDIDNYAPQVVEEALAEYNKIGNQANSILGKNKIDFQEKDSEIREVGKMGYAFKHAVNNFSIYTILILAGCILLDFVIVIIILLVTTSEQEMGSNERRRNIGNSIV